MKNLSYIIVILFITVCLIGLKQAATPCAYEKLTKTPSIPDITCCLCGSTAIQEGSDPFDWYTVCGKVERAMVHYRCPKCVGPRTWSVDTYYPHSSHVLSKTIIDICPLCGIPKKIKLVMCEGDYISTRYEFPHNAKVINKS